MAQPAKHEQLRNITGSILLFGGTQAFNILIRIVQNKIVAILLGPAGLGLIGLCNTIIHLMQIGCGLGVNQSAVRNIAAARDETQKNARNEVIFAVKNLSVCLGIGGILITCALSPLLSCWLFGGFGRIALCCVLGVIVCINIIYDIQLSILKGLHCLRDIAKIYVLGSITGLAVSIPCYYFLGQNGIIPSLLLTAATLCTFSCLLVKKNHTTVPVEYRRILGLVKSIVLPGIMLMLSSFVLNLANFAIMSVIKHYGTLKEVGLYVAGTTLIYQYFGVILSSMVNDYFPRISAVFSDNRRVMIEMNRQSFVQMLMVFPCIVTFMIFLPLCLRILYTADFLSSAVFIRIAMFGVFLGVCTSPLDLILIAKNQNAMYLTVMIVSRMFLIICAWWLHHLYGLPGIGLAMALHGLMHYAGVQILIYCRHKIYYGLKTQLCTAGIILCMGLGYGIAGISGAPLRYGVGAAFCAGVWILAAYIFVKKLKFNIKNMFCRSGEK